MTHSLDFIESNPDDFKVCTKCKKINWYENDSCCSCGKEEFNLEEDFLFQTFQTYKEGQVKYYLEEYNYDDNELEEIVDNLEMNV